MSTKAPAERFAGQVTLRPVQTFDYTPHCGVCGDRWRPAPYVLTVLVDGHRVLEVGCCDGCASETRSKATS